MRVLGDALTLQHFLQSKCSVVDLHTIAKESYSISRSHLAPPFFVSIHACFRTLLLCSLSSRFPFLDVFPSGQSLTPLSFDVLVYTYIHSLEPRQTVDLLF